MPMTNAVGEHAPEIVAKAEREFRASFDSQSTHDVDLHPEGFAARIVRDGGVVHEKPSVELLCHYTNSACRQICDQDSKRLTSARSCSTGRKPASMMSVSRGETAGRSTSTKCTTPRWT